MSAPVLSVRGVRKAFGPHVVLDDVELDVHAHQVVCLIGASGSGKSTLLRCIDLLDEVDDGTIELDGRELHNWLPWHFDHAYNDELNRAGVLRPVTIAPEGGLTGFADGVALYDSLSPAFASDLEHLVQQCDLWLHGHVHDALDYRIGRARVVANPGGYPGEKGGFDAYGTVEV